MYTNLRPEHIEAHGSFENYRQAKVNLFERVAHKSNKPEKLFFVNEGDPYNQYFVSAANGSGEVRYFSRENFIEKELNGGREKIGDWLSSDFNLENAAAAAAFAESQGIDWPAIKKTLRSFSGVPGRMEIIQEKPFKVVIDYAHTPDSLEKVYRALVHNPLPTGRQGKSAAKKSKLVCVLGSAGGGRDKWKRPRMGKIASQYCREVILTNEDPYDEQAEDILEEIAVGCEGVADAKIILDRREAIKTALEIAKNGDTVVITGKGSEAWVHIANGKKIPWNERKTVEELL